METPSSFQNKILDGLGADDVNRLLPHLRQRRVSLRQVLYQEGARPRHVYFPCQGVVISLLRTMQDGREFEVAVVGNEGFAELMSVLGGPAYLSTAVVLAPGECYQVEAEALRLELQRSASLRDHLNRYAAVLVSQLVQMAVCNRACRLEQRLARWLLMTRDGARTLEFPITHEFLSILLGVARSEVTTTAGYLRKAGLISYQRGCFRILDEDGLEGLACECYKICRQQ